MKDKTLKNISDHINTNGGRIAEAGEGKIFTKFQSGNRISTTIRARFLVKFGGKTVANHTFHGAIFHLHKLGLIDLYPFGFETCPKCSGTGNVGYNVDGGKCWKCNSHGLIETK